MCGSVHDLVLVYSSKLFVFCVRIQINFFFCAGRKIIVYSVGNDSIISCAGGRN